MSGGEQIIKPAIGAKPLGAMKHTKIKNSYTTWREKVWLVANEITIKRE